MDETVETTVETTVDDWDIGEVSLDDPDTDDYENEPEQPKADPQTETGEPEKKTDTEKATEPEIQPADRYELKYLGEVKSVNKDEVVKLAQMGLDYDRIRAKYDDIKADIEQYAGLEDGISYLKELAESSRMPVDKFVTEMRVNALKEAGWTEAAARDRVAYDSSKRADAAKQSKADRAAKSEADKKAERELQYKELINRFPDVKPDAIPPEVFAEMENGRRLPDAYELHTAKAENKALSEKVDALTKELDAVKKNAENSVKAIGSKATAGNKTIDPYIEDFLKD